MGRSLVTIILVFPQLNLLFMPLLISPMGGVRWLQKEPVFFLIGNILIFFFFFPFFSFFSVDRKKGPQKNNNCIIIFYYYYRLIKFK